MSKDIGDLFNQAVRLKRLGMTYAKLVFWIAPCLAMAVLANWSWVAQFLAGGVLGSAGAVVVASALMLRNERQANAKLMKLDEAFAMSGVRFESKEQMIKYVVSEALSRK